MFIIYNIMSSILRKELLKVNTDYESKNNYKENFADKADDSAVADQLKWHQNNDKRKYAINSLEYGQKIVLVENVYYYITKYCDALTIGKTSKSIEKWLKKHNDIFMEINYKKGGSVPEFRWNSSLEPTVDNTLPIINIVGNYPFGNKGPVRPGLENSYTYVGLNLSTLYPDGPSKILNFRNAQDIKEQKYKCINLNKVNRNYNTGEEYLSGDMLKIDDSVFRLKNEFQPDHQFECYEFVEYINSLIATKKYLESGIKSRNISKGDKQWDVHIALGIINSAIESISKRFVDERFPETPFIYFTFGKGGICTGDYGSISNPNQCKGWQCKGIYEGTTCGVPTGEGFTVEGFTTNEEMNTVTKDFVDETEWIRESQVPGGAGAFDPDNINKMRRRQQASSAPSGADKRNSGVGTGLAKKKPERWESDFKDYICRGGKWYNLNNFCEDGGGDNVLFFTKRPETNTGIGIWPNFRYNKFQPGKVSLGCWGDYDEWAAKNDAKNKFNQCLDSKKSECNSEKEEAEKSWADRAIEDVGGAIDTAVSDVGSGLSSAGNEIGSWFSGFQNEKEGFLFGGDDGWGSENKNTGTVLNPLSVPTFDMEGCKINKCGGEYNFSNWWPKTDKYQRNRNYTRSMSGLGNKNISSCQSTAKRRGNDIWSLQAFNSASYNTNGTIKTGKGECYGENVNIAGKLFNSWHPAWKNGNDGYYGRGISGNYKDKYGDIIPKGNAQQLYNCNNLGRNGPSWVNKVERERINIFHKDKCGGKMEDVATGNVRKIYLCPQYDSSNLGKYVFIDYHYGFHFFNNSHRIFRKPLAKRANLKTFTSNGITYGEKSDDFELRRTTNYYSTDKHSGIIDHLAITSDDWDNIATSSNTQGFTVENFSQEYNMDPINKKRQDANYDILGKYTIETAVESDKTRKEINRTQKKLDNDVVTNRRNVDEAKSLLKIVLDLEDEKKEGFSSDISFAQSTVIEAEKDDAAARLAERLKHFFTNRVTFDAQHEITSLDVKSKQGWMILWATLLLATLSFKIYLMSKK